MKKLDVCNIIETEIIFASRQEGVAMIDMNAIIASNILAILKKQNKKQINLAIALQTNKQMVSKMLNGTRMINAIELKQIADFLGVTMQDLTKLQGNIIDIDIVHVFIGKVESEEAKKALKIADTLSNMILFHSKVKEHGMKMMETYDA